jgi:hypothetical protein
VLVVERGKLLTELCLRFLVSEMGVSRAAFDCSHVRTDVAII